MEDLYRKITTRDQYGNEWAHFEPVEPVGNAPKAGDSITFELQATQEYHSHEVLRLDMYGNCIVECDGKELTVKPEEIRAVYHQ